MLTPPSQHIITISFLKGVEHLRSTPFATHAFFFFFTYKVSPVLAGMI